ncbi:methyltransferase, partial [Candidatus Woesearchaeota archaeon]|nr:methyltransferase [Candidatus Woesearchaeota archaeon]
IKFRKSDLFKNIKDKFNLIIFNPPYLPELKDEPKKLAQQISGGKKGYELLERFLSKANSYLEKKGKILIVFSSLTNKQKIDEIIGNYGFNFTVVSISKIPHERLYVYLIERSSLLERLNELKIRNIQKFAKGHRGIIWKAKLKNKNIAVKSKLPESKAMGNIQREAEWLKILNKKGIGPKLLMADKDFFCYEFVEGVFIKDFIKKADKQKIRSVLKEVLKQCHTLDKLKINKEEMHHPTKHIIIGKKITLIDFERANKTIKPHNTTQFCQYIINQRNLLNKKGFEISRENMIKLAKSYKESSIITPIIKAIN